MILGDDVQLSDLAKLSGGMIANVVSFDADGTRYIARFLDVDYERSVKRSEFAISYVERSGSPFPVPHIVGSKSVRLREYTPIDKGGAGGNFMDISVVVMTMLPGEPLEQVQDAGKRHLVPELIESMDAIRQVDVSTTTGWGEIGEDGNGKFGSWRDSLASVANEIDELISDEARKIFRREDFDYFFDRLSMYWDAMPESDRSLVHSDWGWDNVLILHGKVSAVVDWDDAKFGDPLTDPARQDFYYPEIDFRSRFVEFYERSGWKIENFRERWLACQLSAMLNDLKWYSYQGWVEPYAWIKARMRYLLGEGEPVGRHP